MGYFVSKMCLLSLALLKPQWSKHSFVTCRLLVKPIISSFLVFPVSYFVWISPYRVILNAMQISLPRIPGVETNKKCEIIFFPFRTNFLNETHLKILKLEYQLSIESVIPGVFLIVCRWMRLDFYFLFLIWHYSRICNVVFVFLNNNLIFSVLNQLFERPIVRQNTHFYPALRWVIDTLEKSRRISNFFRRINYSLS